MIFNCVSSLKFYQVGVTQNNWDLLTVISDTDVLFFSVNNIFIWKKKNKFNKKNSSIKNNLIQNN